MGGGPLYVTHLGRLESGTPITCCRGYTPYADHRSVQAGWQCDESLLHASVLSQS